MSDRITRLTKRQADCLKLVAQGYTSKEIGRKLGISFTTVDNHIKAAVQLLEVEGRAEAGRLYLQRVETAGSQQLISQPESLVEVRARPDELRTAQPREWWQTILSLLPPIGGKENALSPSQSVLAVFRIALLAALAFIACVIVLRMSFQALT